MHEIEKRDRQVGIDMAWHNLTEVVDEVTPQLAHPFEVKAYPCPAVISGPEEHGDAIIHEKVIHEDAYHRLIASDDLLPIGPPFNPETYTPSSIASFWAMIEKGLKGHDYQIISAGSIRNRKQIFASLKLRPDTTKIGNREFVDFLTVLDSFDGSCARQARYSSVCVVCANTFSAALGNGEKLGKAYHKKGLEDASSRIADSIEVYFSQAEEIDKLLQKSFGIQIVESEARCWIAGVDNAKKAKMSMADLQRTARMTELFRFGKGNVGQTRLDAFSAITEFHTHESGKMRKTTDQWILSEFGTSADAKELALMALDNWDEFEAKGAAKLKAIGANI